MSKRQRIEMKIFFSREIIMKNPVLILSFYVKKEYYPTCLIFVGDYVRCIIAKLIINVHAMRVVQRGNRWN